MGFLNVYFAEKYCDDTDLGAHVICVLVLFPVAPRPYKNLLVVPPALKPAVVIEIVPHVVRNLPPTPLGRGCGS